MAKKAMVKTALSCDDRKRPCQTFLFERATMCLSRTSDVVSDAIKSLVIRQGEDRTIVVAFGTSPREVLRPFLMKELELFDDCEDQEELESLEEILRGAGV